MKKLIISAPFGNYFDWPEATSTLGTFTRDARGGLIYRLWRILRTVRYYPSIQAWSNRLGLPNPGIDWLSRQVETNKIDTSNKIVSLYATESWDWAYLFGSCYNIIKPAYIELNVSCPNLCEVNHMDYGYLFRCAAKLFPERVIVKLPPIKYNKIVQLAIDNEITKFHCCNTLQTPGGGLSGKPLKELSIECIKNIKCNYPTHGVIGGGGITSMKDINDYFNAGATNVAIASTLFFPWNWKKFRKISEQL